jgi:hypothetical protein
MAGKVMTYAELVRAQQADGAGDDSAIQEAVDDPEEGACGALLPLGPSMCAHAHTSGPRSRAGKPASSDAWV